MLFNFALVPLNEIKPWGAPERPNLHWFGLTDSQYWIEAGAARLLEYSDGAPRRGTTRFCDYQVARLYEDVVDLAPHVLEPIPPDLARFIAGQGRTKTLDCLSAWRDKNAELDDDPYWSVVDLVSTWISQRQLDTLYLRPSADIRMWSDESMVHVEWDNRDKRIDGQAAWTAPLGTFSLTRSDFVAECRSFHERLMDAMSERVGQVLASAISPDIQVDLDGLVREHEQRRQLSSLNFDALPSPTDWVAVREAIGMIGA